MLKDVCIWNTKSMPIPEIWPWSSSTLPVAKLTGIQDHSVHRMKYKFKKHFIMNVNVFILYHYTQEHTGIILQTWKSKKISYCIMSEYLLKNYFISVLEIKFCSLYQRENELQQYFYIINNIVCTWNSCIKHSL
jgi:hypothetical protein